MTKTEIIKKYESLNQVHYHNKNDRDLVEQMMQEYADQQLILSGVSSSALKSDLLADIKMSCDGTYSDAIDDWDLVDTAEDVINRINKTVDKHYC